MVDISKEKPLVEKAKEGNRAAFAELVRLYGDRIYRLALRITANEKDAEDVYQDTFLMAFKKIDQFKRDSSFFTWIYRIAINMAFTKIKQRKKNFYEESLNEPDFDRIELKETDSWQEVDISKLDSDKFKRKLNETLEKLPEFYRTVFILRDLHGLSTEQTANILGITPSNTKVRLMRARRMLKNELEDFLKKEGII